MADYLLDLLDLGAPYLPRAVTAPLYTIANQLPSSPSDVINNPSSVLPLIVTVFSAYLAVNQFLSTVRWGVRTAFTFLKLGVVASVVMAVWKAYDGVGTDKGVTGGIREAYGTAEKVGRGIWNVGKQGSGWYFAGTGRDTSRSARRTRRSTAKSTNAKKRMWEDPDEVDLAQESTEDFVKNALDKARGIWGMFNPDESSSSTSNSNARRASKKRGETGGEGSGFVWNLLANQAKKVYQDAVEGLEQPGVKTTKKQQKRTTTRR